MTRLILVAAAALSFGCASTARNAGSPHQPAGIQFKRADRPTGSLKPFQSDHDLRQTLAAVMEAQRQHRERALAEEQARCQAWAKAVNIVGITCSSGLAETVSVTSAPSVTSITNTQEAGVDEGGIVKRRGDLLIVLRRGRLFTIDTADGRLNAVDVADAFGETPDHEPPGHVWYDELLVSDNTIVVIGFSYELRATEIGLFDLSVDGHVRHRATHHLRSDDYYSRSDYASRLIGKTLLLYTTNHLPGDATSLEWLPALRRMRPGRTEASFERFVSAGQVFQPPAPLSTYPTVHTLIRCDLAAATFSCNGTVLLGNPLDAFYSSASAVYAWTTSGEADELNPGLLYRIPFDGSPVAAIQTHGRPENQFAFHESEDGRLHVVVSQPDDVVALLRIPVEFFSDGSMAAPRSSYRTLHTGASDWTVSRFIGPYVLVGGQAHDPEAVTQWLVASPWAGSSTFFLPLTHGVERIEAVGPHAVVVGTGDHGSDLRLTAIRLATTPTVAGTLVQEHAFQSDIRSHAFFYRADDDTSGVFGLPAITVVEDDNGLDRESSSVMFVRNHNLALTLAGQLEARYVDEGNEDDDCVVSCTDWYGNARPIFMSGRVFALMGYELVEGRMGRRGIREIRRIDFMPRVATR